MLWQIGALGSARLGSAAGVYGWGCECVVGGGAKRDLVAHEGEGQESSKRSWFDWHNGMATIAQ